MCHIKADSVGQSVFPKNSQKEPIPIKSDTVTGTVGVNGQNRSKLKISYLSEPDEFHFLYKTGREGMVMTVQNIEKEMEQDEDNYSVFEDDIQVCSNATDVVIDDKVQRGENRSGDVVDNKVQRVEGLSNVRTDIKVEIKEDLFEFVLEDEVRKEDSFSDIILDLDDKLIEKDLFRVGFDVQVREESCSDIVLGNNVEKEERLSIVLGERIQKEGDSSVVEVFQGEDILDDNVHKERTLSNPFLKCKVNKESDLSDVVFECEVQNDETLSGAVMYHESREEKYPFHIVLEENVPNEANDDIPLLTRDFIDISDAFEATADLQSSEIFDVGSISSTKDTVKEKAKVVHVSDEKCLEADNFFKEQTEVDALKQTQIDNEGGIQKTNDDSIFKNENCYETDKINKFPERKKECDNHGADSLEIKEERSERKDWDYCDPVRACSVGADKKSPFFSAKDLVRDKNDGCEEPEELSSEEDFPQVDVEMDNKPLPCLRDWVVVNIEKIVIYEIKNNFEEEDFLDIENKSSVGDREQSHEEKESYNRTKNRCSEDTTTSWFSILGTETEFVDPLSEDSVEIENIRSEKVNDLVDTDRSDEGAAGKMPSKRKIYDADDKSRRIDGITIPVLKGCFVENVNVVPNNKAEFVNNVEMSLNKIVAGDLSSEREAETTDSEEKYLERNRIKEKNKHVSRKKRTGFSIPNKEYIPEIEVQNKEGKMKREDECIKSKSKKINDSVCSLKRESSTSSVSIDFERTGFCSTELKLNSDGAGSKVKAKTKRLKVKTRKRRKRKKLEQEASQGISGSLELLAKENGVQKKTIRSAKIKMKDEIFHQAIAELTKLDKEHNNVISVQHHVTKDDVNEVESEIKRKQTVQEFSNKSLENWMRGENTQTVSVPYVNRPLLDMGKSSWTVTAVDKDILALMDELLSTLQNEVEKEVDYVKEDEEEDCLSLHVWKSVLLENSVEIELISNDVCSTSHAFKGRYKALPARITLMKKRSLRLDLYLLSNLQSPFTASIVADFSFRGGLCLVTPQSTYGTLEEVTKLDPHRLHIKVDEAELWMYGLLDGLAYLSGEGIVHGGLSPGDILLDDKALPKISGLECAYPYYNTPVLPKDDNFILEYAAPERVRSGDKIEPVSDIFSIGCIIHEVLFGSTPFKGFSKEETVSNILNRVNSPFYRYTTIPPRFSSVVESCLRKSISARKSGENIRRTFLSSGAFYGLNKMKLWAVVHDLCFPNDNRH